MFKPQKYVEMAKKTGKTASLCMVTFNRWERTRQSLASIFKNTHLPHILTVVDNASWDGTREKLKGLKRKGRIDTLILLPENVGIGKGKNFGLRAWEGKAAWYVCIDNDIIVSPYWLAYLCYASTLTFSNSKYKGLGIVGANVQGFGTRLKWFTPTLWKKVNGVILDNSPNPGGIYVMSRATFEKIGYFREWSLYGLEDSELHTRQKQYGLRSAYVRNVNCKELSDVKFKMKDGRSYRDFKTRTHNTIVEKLRELQKDGKYLNVKHYKTSVTKADINKYVVN